MEIEPITYEKNMNMEWVALIQFFQEKLDEVFDGAFRVELVEKEVRGEVSRALRIFNKNGRDIRTAKVIQFIDWDDSSENYSARKNELQDDLVEVFRGLNIPKKIFSLLNRVCRVLPHSEVGPRRYSEYLELVATSALQRALQKREKSTALVNFLARPTLQAAREYVQEVIRNFLAEKFETPVINGELFFVKKNNTVLSISESASLPRVVSPELTKLFQIHLTDANTTLSAHLNSLLAEDGYWVVNTFGDLVFQLEKIFNTLLLRKEKGERIPDEVLLYLDGRKIPVLEKIILQMMAEFGEKQIEIMDDSMGQIESMLESDLLRELIQKQLIKIKRIILKLAKRSSGATPAGVEEVQFE